MKKKALTLSVIAFSLFVFYKGGFALNIITPDDKTYVENPFVYIVGNLENDKTTHITVTVNDLKSPQISIKDPEYVQQFKDYFILDIELDEGENLVGITAYSGGKIIEDKKIKVYYLKPGGTPNKGVNRLYFHRDEKEKKCAECHKVEKGTCLECHKKIIAKKYVHGPAGSGDCEVCHDYNPQNGVKYLVKQNFGELCKDCHDALNPARFEYLHGPFAVGKCEACHNLHSSDYAHQLLVETNELCKNCHASFKAPDLSHVVTKHPLSGKKDMSRPGELLQCSSCHNPHGEKGPFFFVKGATNRMDLCKICHQK
jgi:predicted CXXCH cytochrome family protein